jgi:hypothetical protein
VLSCICVSDTCCDANRDCDTINFSSEYSEVLSVCDSVVSESALVLSTDTTVQALQHYTSEIGLLVWDEMKGSNARKVGLNPNKYLLNP